MGVEPGEELYRLRVVDVAAVQHGRDAALADRLQGAAHRGVLAVRVTDDGDLHAAFPLLVRRAGRCSLAFEPAAPARVKCPLLALRARGHHPASDLPYSAFISASTKKWSPHATDSSTPRR